MLFQSFRNRPAAGGAEIGEGSAWPGPRSAQPCQGWGRGFESPRPLQYFQRLATKERKPTAGGEAGGKRGKGILRSELKQNPQLHPDAIDRTSELKPQPGATRSIGPSPLSPSIISNLRGAEVGAMLAPTSTSLTEGRGNRSFTAATGVRIPLGTLIDSMICDTISPDKLPYTANIRHRCSRIHVDGRVLLISLPHPKDRNDRCTGSLDAGHSVSGLPGGSGLRRSHCSPPRRKAVGTQRLGCRRRLPRSAVFFGNSLGRGSAVGERVALSKEPTRSTAFPRMTRRVSSAAFASRRDRHHRYLAGPYLIRLGAGSWRGVGSGNRIRPKS
jgi:hypothetical protein